MKIGPLPKARGKRSKKAWKNLGDRLVTQYGRGMPCAVCGTLENVCLHHILHKSVWNEYRFSLENLVPLCPQHHRFSKELAAHSDNTLAQARFRDWLQENLPEQWEWVWVHEETHVRGCKPDWEDLVLRMHAEMLRLQEKK